MHAQRFFLGIRPPKSGQLSFRPPKGTSLRGTTPVDVLSVTIGAVVSALACRKNPRTKKRNNEKKKPSKDNFTYTGVKNPWTHRNEILHDDRAPWCSMAYSLVHSYLSLFSGSFVRIPLWQLQIAMNSDSTLTQPVFERMLLSVFTAESLGSPFV